MNAEDDLIAIRTCGLGKMYKMYASRRDHIMDVLGLSSLCFWKKQKYREFWALRGIDLVVRKGERVGIIGHNGAGKSTLLKTLIGAHEPTEGSMYINGRIQALMQLGTGFHPDFTGRENIRASLGYNNLSAREIAECEEEIIDFTELEDFIDQPVKNYSAGMYARLAFATATSIKPEILIIDEVLGAGDAYFAGKCVERMKALSVESGATVLFVSHDLASVQNMCNRCIWIDRGIMKADGPSLEVIKKYSAQVRQREELRLKIRNEKKVFSNKSVDVDYSAQLLFRLRAAEGGSVSFPVRKISFCYQKDASYEVCPGMPMDSDSSQGAFLFLNENSAGWSDIKKEGMTWYRTADLSDGKYALGGLVIQKDWNLTNLAAAISYDDKDSGRFYFEYYDSADRQYHIAKTIELKNTGKNECVVFSLVSDAVQQITPQAISESKSVEESPVTARSSIDVFGSGELSVSKLEFGTDSEKKYTFAEGEVVHLYFDVENISSADIETFLGLVTFNEQGTMVNNFISQKMTLPQGKNSFEIVLKNSCFLHRGRYIMSLAFYKYVDMLDGTKPWDVYLCLDRKLEIEIFSERNDKISYGLLDLKEELVRIGG